MEGQWNNGYCEIIYQKDEDECLWIESFSIDEDYRGQGLARLALTEFIEETKDDKLFGIKLIACAETSCRSHLRQHLLEKFYESFGFTIYNYCLVGGKERPMMVALKHEWLANLDK